MSQRLKGFDEVREEHSIEDVAARLGITPTYKSNGKLICLCPFHDDRSPSFVIDPVLGKCECKVPGCFSWGDIFDLVMRHQGFSNAVQAKWWIEGGTTATNRPQKKQRQSPAIDSAYLKSRFTESLRQQKLSVSYLTERSIPESAAKDYGLGAFPMWRPKRVKYVMRDKTEIDMLPATRFTIPWRWHDRIHGMKLRLDMTSARDTFAMTDKRLLDRVRGDLAEKLKVEAKDISDDRLIEALIGGRYMAYGSFANRIFNADLLVQPQGGQLVYPRIPVLLVEEGEYNTMCLTHIAKMPAVAVKRSIHAKQAFQSVGVLVIVQNNDQAGEHYAHGIIADAGRVEGQDAFIIVPPSPYNDTNDLVKAGILCDWLHTELNRLNLLNLITSPAA